ncbi:MAG: insulinase family protein [Ignavibacteria bacterium]|nr:insulinase family protein [Ignavibacteria bacterium]
MKKYKTSLGSNTDALLSGKKIDFKEYKLSNGLHCILYKDNINPIVNVTVGYKVGSKDEDVNKKGIAHLFEHMMFQGSDNIKKNEHFQYVMKSGGVCNAFTMNDATVYYEMMPANNLEIALWLESDRMNSLNISEENLTNQKNVVIEEKKQVYENAPYGSSFHNIFKNVFSGSNYESPVIGFTDDINSFTVEEAMNFHDTYYSPKNAVLMISGDINYTDAENLINKYFGNIEKNKDISRKENHIKEMKKDVELEVHDNVQLPVLNICFQTPKSGEKGNYAMEYLTEIIANNKSSRLYKKLVYEKQLVKYIKAFKYSLEDSGILIIKAMINPGANVGEIKNEIFQSINDLRENGLSDEEFQKIKNQIEFENTVKYLKIQNISVETIFNYLYFKNTGRINDEIQRYLSVTKQDVINAVNDYVLSKNKLVLTYLPKVL